jgi:hypothetical protein
MTVLSLAEPSTGRASWRHVERFQSMSARPTNWSRAHIADSAYRGDYLPECVTPAVGGTRAGEA